MSDINWTFERTPRMGGATGEAYSNALQATGMSPVAVLARESIQNSCDAEDGSNDKVRVVFRRVQLIGDEKKAFVKHAGLDGTFQEHSQSLVLQDSCLDNIEDPNTPLSLLYIEDYGTHGLFGKPFDPDSHFFRLLLSLGDSSKLLGRDSGGSYGFGKSVYSANSRIQTIFAYSKFDSTYAQDDVDARLFGCAFFKAHKMHGIAYSGRAWFGVSKEDEVDPSENQKAHDVASLLGFTKREVDEEGTSMLIVDSSVDIEELRTSIEEWWWPRLLEDNIDIDMYDQHQRISPPRPRRQPFLKPFIECFNLATGKANIAQANRQKIGELHRMHNTPLGSYAYTMLSEDELVDEKIQQDKLGCIALIRSTRMVITYMNAGGSSQEAIGVFVADSKIDRFLRLSEPISHDKWDPKSSRLDLESGNAKEFVSAVVDRLRNGLRRFTREATPQMEDVSHRPKPLERLLGNLFKPTTKEPGGGGGGSVDPVRIHFLSQPHIKTDGLKLRTASTFSVGLDPQYEEDSATVKLCVRCLVTEDRGVDEQDTIPVVLECSDVDYTWIDKQAAEMQLTLEKEIEAKIKAVSDPYDADWTTLLRVEVSRD